MGIAKFPLKIPTVAVLILMGAAPLAPLDIMSIQMENAAQSTLYVKIIIL